MQCHLVAALPRCVSVVTQILLSALGVSAVKPLCWSDGLSEKFTVSVISIYTNKIR
jgi:hypothetical protein